MQTQRHGAGPRRVRRAFTLIELLIVVAIIAILAAIAVPNFLEAQTRSKVTRAKADMRTLATGAEAYRVDYNRYPLTATEDGELIDPASSASLAAAPEFLETRMSSLMTTPVAYLTSLLNEPFPGKEDGVPENPQFHYSTADYARAHGGDEEHEEYLDYMADLSGRSPQVIAYYLLSHGPDQDHDAPSGHHHRDEEEDDGHDHDEEEGGGAVLYDPTNGTISNGDLAYFGPGMGFVN